MAHTVRKQGQFTQPSEAGWQNDGASGKLRGKVALIAGGDGGLGRAVALALAREGADIAIVYFSDHRGAEQTRQAILRHHVRCNLVAGNIASEGFCRCAVKRCLSAFDRLDILVNNTAEQPSQTAPQDTAHDQGAQTFHTDLLGIFRLTKAATPHLRSGGAIINTTAVTAWWNNSHLIDDPATRLMIVSFTRSLAKTLVGRRIRVNAITPSLPRMAPTADHASSNVRREQAPALDGLAANYVLLAVPDRMPMTGQVLHARAIPTAA